MKNKTNFDPNKIKFYLEYKNFGRVTDSKLAEMLKVKTNTITRWKKKSPKMFDKIHQTGIPFEDLMEIPSGRLLELLNIPKSNKYHWDKKRPNILTDTADFFKITGIKFEEIYDDNN